MLRVHEIFHSIQGEGPFSGTPAVFLRLSGCLKPYCAFCDTPEAREGGEPMAVEAIFHRMATCGASLAVITGGEPFMQWHQGLRNLESRLLAAGMEVQYESSGRAGIPEDVRGKVVLSPKPGQWPAREVLHQAFAIKPLLGDDAETVLRALADSGLAPERIWLMALGANRDTQIRRMPELWDICVRHGYHFCPRLHILVHDRKKGI